MRVFNNSVNNYMMMPRDFLRNPRLSLEAKGTMSMWIYFRDIGIFPSKVIEILCNWNTDRDLLLKSLKELLEEGYLITIPCGEEFVDLDDDVILGIRELPENFE